MSEEYKPRILIDITFLFDQYAFRGIGRYGKDMLKELIPLVSEENAWELHLIGFNDLNKNLIALGFSKFRIEDINNYISFHSLGDPIKSNWKNLIRWGSSYKPILKAVEPEVFWAIHFERGIPNFGRFKISDQIKTVVTAHDAIPLISSSFSKKGPIINWLKGLFYKRMWNGVKNADLVIAPSNFTKNDLIEHGHVSEHKIKRIYEGVGERFFKSNIEISEEKLLDLKNRFAITGIKYFFYDSGLEGSKGIDQMIEILSEIWKGNKLEIPKYLVLTGGGALYKGVGKDIKPRNEIGKNFLNACKKQGILDSIISTGKVNDEDLVVLLSDAYTYIYTSQYEGFGLGPVQAMAAEVPTIVANTSCLPEITAGGALLIDTKDVSKSVEIVTEFLSNANQMNEFVQKGKEVVKKYNWELAAKETWIAIKGLV